MRVISGTARGRKLKKVPGDTTRPIMDRVKENLFNILGDYVPGSRWLDLFGGTGQVGIEALSRGAAHCTFVDSARLAVRTMQENLRHTDLYSHAKTIQGDAFSYLRRPNHTEFDVIYVAPPQYLGIWASILREINARPQLLTPEGIVIVQIDPKEYEEFTWQNLEQYDSRIYGNTRLDFYELKSE